jgi:hypothetical protein
VKESSREGEGMSKMMRSGRLFVDFSKSNEEAMNLRSENDWTMDLQPHTVTTATHDDDDTVVVTDEETYETHYGLRDPMLDVLFRSYLHTWTMKGAHVRFVTYTEHTAKCKAATITKWSSATFSKVT